MYDSLLMVVILAILGASLGSFAAASVWRLRARQLVIDQKAGYKVSKSELKQLKPLSIGAFGPKDHSRCLHCGHQLRWFELIPVISWLSLKGKCRYCHKGIGWYEFIMEISLAAFFVVSYIVWPGGLESGLAITHFILWLSAGVVMAMLFAYDLKWFLLPDILTALLAVIGVGVVAVSAFASQDALGVILNALGAVLILSGLYGVLYFVSKGNWVGFGDVKLGIGLALLLHEWQLAILALFMANLIGCFIVIPLLLTKKLKRTSHVPFGPMLIAGTVLVWFTGWYLLSWYGSLLLTTVTF